MSIQDQLEALGIHVLSGHQPLMTALTHGLEVCLGQDEEGRWVHACYKDGQVVVRRETAHAMVVFKPCPPTHGPHGDLPDCLCNACTSGMGDSNGD